MPLNEQYQLSLLKDILKNHQLDCCGTVSECEQLERLIQSLVSNQQISENVKSTLLDVYNYSQNGRSAGNLENHISQHQQSLSMWIDDLNYSTLT